MQKYIKFRINFHVDSRYLCLANIYKALCTDMRYFRIAVTASRLTAKML